MSLISKNKHLGGLFMENRRNYVCPNCKQRYYQVADNSVTYCPKCHSALVVDIEEAGFSNKMPPKRTRTSKKDLADSEMLDTLSAMENPSFGWIDGLKFFSWLGFLAILVKGIISAIPLFQDSSTTSQIYVFFTVIVTICAAFLFVACMMVLLGMASDLRTIRISLQNIRRKQR